MNVLSLSLKGGRRRQERLGFHGLPAADRSMVEPAGAIITAGRRRDNYWSRVVPGLQIVETLSRPQGLTHESIGDGRQAEGQF
ncbi:hypothetical protein RRG08_050271 [Elysia crispata]|uniref:Uncharacterized protein n=1 Tax=Elysia crispata TaxID=231223 RepID=A0AAE1B3H1_9GAST|nr:hypothetical protein RRG08_050271 [Elysia crispata]